MRTRRGAVMAAAAILVGSRGLASVSSGQLLTNFASATFNLPSGGAAGDVDTGTNNFGVQNSSTGWVLVTDSPQLCMVLWKKGTDTTWNPITGQYPGTAVCFQIGFSNCGGQSGWAVTVTDVLPANVVKGNAPPGQFWVSGGFGGTFSPSSATSLAGPWFTGTNTGLTAPLYMRWVIGMVGMHKSGYIRYCATII